jgi:prefoldin subunit 5
MEIRLAIEEQPRRLGGAQEDGDSSALAQLAHGVNARQDTGSALAQVINNLVPRVATLETADLANTNEIRSLGSKIERLEAQLAELAAKVRG